MGGDKARECPSTEESRTPRRRVSPIVKKGSSRNQQCHGRQSVGKEISTGKSFLRVREKQDPGSKSSEKRH